MQRESMELGGMEDLSEKIVRRRISDAVLDRLKEMIRKGEVSPGHSMPSERQLMERFGVGRPAIREALQSLSNMGLISISHGERARVTELSATTILHQVDTVARMLLSSSPESLENLKQARRFFELGMVREAAVKAAPDTLAELRAILDAQRSHLGKPRAFIQADIRFHRKIAAMSGNPIFVAVSEAMLNWLFQYHTELLIWTGSEDKTLAEHERIIECLAAADPAAAEAAMRQHLDRSGDMYRHHS